MNSLSKQLLSYPESLYGTPTV